MNSATRKIQRTLMLISLAPWLCLIGTLDGFAQSRDNNNVALIGCDFDSLTTSQNNYIQSIVRSHPLDIRTQAINSFEQDLSDFEVTKIKSNWSFETFVFRIECQNNTGKLKIVAIDSRLLEGRYWSSSEFFICDGGYSVYRFLVSLHDLRVEDFSFGGL